MGVLQLLPAELEQLSVLDFFALVAYNGAQTTAWGATVEVGIGLLYGHTHHGALNTDGAFHGWPPKCERSKGVATEIGGLSALVVGVPHEATLVKGFEKDHSGGGSAAFIGCGKTHGVWFVLLCAACLVEPG